MSTTALTTNGKTMRSWLRRQGASALVAAAAWCGTGMDAVGADASATVDGHLAAGEFGLALQAAKGAEGGNRAELVDRIGAARRGPGSVRDEAPEVKSRPQDGGARGGNFANPQELMNLIRQQTSGKWTQGQQGGFGQQGTEPEPGEGTMSWFSSGVKVNPNGLLETIEEKDQTGALAAMGVRARQAAVNTDMAKSSKLRAVSLTRLEKDVAERIRDGQSTVESMEHLAGLTSIKYVFFYPESGEVVIAGPAEGWQVNGQGRTVGVNSGRPTLLLDDLVTVLRTFSKQGQQVFGCSIDPRPEGLAQVKAYAEQSQNSGPLAPGTVRKWAQELKERLGEQNVSIYGIPGDSHVARVIVEADYRMKLIGVGKLNAGPDVPDYFKLMAQNPKLASGSLDALRWWLSMKCDAVMHSPERTAFELQGSSVLCQSENQFVTAEGGRIGAGKAEPLNQEFAGRFTKHFGELAKKDTVFAELQNVFDLALVAAIVQRAEAAGTIQWNNGEFDVDGGYEAASYRVPKTVDTVVNHRVFNQKDIVVQVAGGVRAEIGKILAAATKGEAKAELSGLSEKGQAPELPAGRWWWDVK